MKAKGLIFIAAACSLLAALFSLAFFGLFSARAEAEEVVSLGKDNASLFLPSSYEQYLALTSPTSVAMSEDYIVIADGTAESGSKLYIYDRAAGKYSSYEHMKFDRPEEHERISKVQIFERAGQDRIFFCDGGNHLYEYSAGLTSRQMVISDVNAETFLIADGALFTGSAAESEDIRVTRYSIAAGFTSSTASCTISGKTPKLAYEDGVLYLAYRDESVVSFDASNLNQRSRSYLDSAEGHVTGLQSVCVFGGDIYFTVGGSGSYPAGLYRSRGGAVTPLPFGHNGEGLSTLSSYAGELYCICNNSVHKLTVSEEGVSLADYEIAAGSPSDHRIKDGTDTARAGDLLVISDAGNGRVDVYDRATGERAVIPCDDGSPYTPSLVSTDGDIIAVAGKEKDVYLYRRGESAPFYKQSTDNQPVKGLACVYGSVYFVTAHSFGKAAEGSSTIQRDNMKGNVALASDLYGDLYVVYNDGSVTRFTERNFLNNTETGETLPFTVKTSLLTESFVLRADFEGNLYYLDGYDLCRNGAAIATFSDHSDDGWFVYGGASEPLSLAIGFEDGELYFLFGNYIVCTSPDAVNIPTLNKISTDGVSSALFTGRDEKGLLVDIPAGTIGIKTNLASIRNDDPPYFPYHSYYRTTADKRGILLAVKDAYAFVILYEDDRTFTANLFRFDPAAYAVPEEDYWTEEESGKYLSSNVSSYFYPCVHTALADERLSRGTRLSVLGYVEAPERAYALVETEGGLRFIPSSYLTDIDPLPSASGKYEHGYIKASEEGVLFTSESGEEIVIYDRTPAEFRETEDGKFVARIERDGKVYTATVEGNMIERGESDALRISLIVILAVLAVIIVGVYIYLVPRRKKEAEPLDNPPQTL